MTLSLLPWSPDHAEAIRAICNDPFVGRYLLDGQQAPMQWVVDEIRASERRFERGSLGMWLAFEGRTAIGFAGYRPFFEPPRLQLVYALLPAYTRRGLATQLSRKVIDAARNAGMAEVLASIDVANEASVRVVQRLGFRLVSRGSEGAFGGTLHYCLDL